MMESSLKCICIFSMVLLLVVYSVKGSPTKEKFAAVKESSFKNNEVQDPLEYPFAKGHTKLLVVAIGKGKFRHGKRCTLAIAYSLILDQLSAINNHFISYTEQMKCVQRGFSCRGMMPCCKSLCCNSSSVCSRRTGSRGLKCSRGEQEQ